MRGDGNRNLFSTIKVAIKRELGSGKPLFRLAVGFLKRDVVHFVPVGVVGILCHVGFPDILSGIPAHTRQILAVGTLGISIGKRVTEFAQRCVADRIVINYRELLAVEFVRGVFRPDPDGISRKFARDMNGLCLIIVSISGKIDIL